LKAGTVDIEGGFLVKGLVFSYKRTPHYILMFIIIISSSSSNSSSRLLSKNLKSKICRTIILPEVLYGCETWSLTLREERRLRVFENRVLRKVFGPKMDEVTGE